MADRWIIGDLYTGDLLYEIMEPMKDCKWSNKLKGHSLSLSLSPGSRLQKLVGEGIRAQVRWPYYVAAMNETGLIEAAGIIGAHTLEEDAWSFDVAPFTDYLSKRLVTPEEQDPDSNPVHIFKGSTWRYCLNAALQSMSVRPDSDRNLIPPLKLHDASGDPEAGPVQLEADPYDFCTMTDMIDQVNKRSDVEAIVLPVWEGTYPEGRLTWEIYCGEDRAPLIVHNSYAWVFDMTAPNPSRALTEWKRRLSDVYSDAWALVGKNASKGGVAYIQHRTLPGDDRPYLDYVLSSNQHDTSEASWDALGQTLRSAEEPVDSCTITVLPDGLPDMLRLRVGDLAVVRIDDSHPFAPPGTHFMRVVSKERPMATGITKLSLQSLRPIDRLFYKKVLG